MCKKLCHVFFIVFLNLLLTQQIHAKDQYIYWTDVSEEKIYRGTIDGSKYETIVNSRDGRVFDIYDGTLYFIDKGSIKCHFLGNDSIRTILTGVRNVAKIIVEPIDQKVYWCESDVGSIRCANLDGTGITDLVAGISYLQDFTVDPTNEYLYWVNRLERKIQRSKLNDSEIEDIIADVGRTADIAVDNKNSKIYWLDNAAWDMKRANLDGSEIETILIDVTPSDIVLDLENGKIYLDDYRGIFRTNLNGTDLEVLVTGFEIIVKNLRLDLNNGKIYWYYEWANMIQRSNLDGTDVEDVIINASEPISVALDIENRHVYWIDYANIYRANTDGSKIKFIAHVTYETIGLTDVALDLDNEMIYWGVHTDFYFRTIGRVSIDGTNIDYSLSFDMLAPYGIALDPAKLKIYWTNAGDTKKSRAIMDINTDGNGKETLVDSLLSPYDLALDLKNNKIYWTEKASMGLIRRSNLDGSNMEDVITGLDSPGGIALDVAGGKMYWAEEYVGKILRANLDGTEVEEIFAGLTAPSRIALTFENNGWTAVDEKKPTDDFIPTQFTLSQNYPNPFNPQTTIQYALPKSCFVSITVYNMLGQEVKTLVNENQTSGYKSVVWDGKNNLGESVPSGVYIYRISAAEFTQSRKLLLLR